MGQSQVSCYGSRYNYYQTPHIDGLAAQGMRFTQAYAGSTVCAPSRCCLETGLHMNADRRFISTFFMIFCSIPF